MANSRFEYVKGFEQHTTLLPQSFIVIRLDGRGFHKISSFYEFDKPNDIRALKLSNAAAKNVCSAIKDVFVAFGESDEYSFILKPDTQLFNRREDKLVSTFVSLYTANYIHLWSKFFPDKEIDLKNIPTFDGRAVIYPNVQIVKDYLSWRFVDTHINNLYNTTFWALVLKGGLSTKQAEEKLKGSLSSDKNEILFKEFGINYNDELEIFKKGSLIYKGEIVHVDVYKKIDEFFKDYL
ncbi:hypothetical protein WICMUC_002166 [Wickerhamomyces mucosus]|uniref:tRNA(His) guanylyltransferase n=1 Tax=Wickerhamomyces mucosus TaxID=1378264 RepID=A0A9P8TES8_9ASCO|nr:hypothetical protein WICMUC_002166 [Wickerhamomyces mucosus]